MGSEMCIRDRVTGKSDTRNSFKVKNKTISIGGPWPPNLTSHPHVPQNLSRGHREAQDGEESWRLRGVVPEKIGVKEKTLAPPGGETGSGRGQMTSWVGRSRGGLQPMRIRCRWGVGGRRYSTESKSRPAPVMEYGKKFCSIRTRDSQKYYYGVVVLNSFTLGVSGVVCRALKRYS